METTTITTPKCCNTCLYRATHEKCDGCLRSEADLALIRNGEDAPDEFRFLNYVEGNWMARLMQAELAGRRNIVVGGQGEAEVNAKRTPEETATQLHYVSRECGYMCGNLRISGLSAKIKIHTDKAYEIEWSRTEESQPWQLDYIWEIDYDRQTGDPTGERTDSWSRKTCEIWPAAE